jgi:hypothetical protein
MAKGKGRWGWVLMVRTAGFGDWLYSYKVYHSRRSALHGRPGHGAGAIYPRRVWVEGEFAIRFDQPRRNPRPKGECNA